MMRTFFATALLVAMMAPGAMAEAYFTDTYGASTDLTLYETDREEPGVFEKTDFDGDSRLRMQVDGSKDTSGFYRFQGKKRLTGTGDGFWHNGVDSGYWVDIYIDPAWASDGAEQHVQLWSQLEGAINYWPTFGFHSKADDSAVLTIWPDADSEANGYELEVDLPTGFTYGWNNFGYELKADGNYWYLNDALVAVNDSWFSSDYQPNGIQTVILQGQNYGEDYDIYFDNLTVPEPATLALVGLGLGGLVARRRRGRK